MTGQITRRTMLRTSAATAAGVWMATAAVVRAEDDKAEHAAAEKAAAALFEAFAAADTQKLKSQLADKVAFMGEGRLVGGLRTEPGAAPAPVNVDSAKLAEGYGTLFEKFGDDKARWTELVGKCKPTLEKAAAKGTPFEYVEAGDFVYDLHFREALKGSRRGYDEAIIFVLRKVGRKFVIIGHFADL